MVQCLYKKFTIRKGIKFEKSSLVIVLMSIGKLALETLLSGKSELERSEITEQVGEEVLEYGLLIGEDGFSFTREMAADILVTFPHRSLQEFLGAFYFVLSLGQKQTVGHLDKALWEYLKNRLFSQFCLWYLEESNRFLSFPQSSTVCELLSVFIAEQIDDDVLDSRKLIRNYPALSLALGVTKNEIALKILEGALVKCSRIKHIVIEPHHPIDRILRSIHPVLFRGMKSIEIFNSKEEGKILIPYESPLQFLCVRKDHSFNLTVKCHFSMQSVDALNVVLKVCEGWNRSVFLRFSKFVPEVSLQNSPLIKTFSIDSCHFNIQMYKLYPQLVNLFITDCGLNSRDISCLAEASARGKLPKLSTLDISDNPQIGGNLSVLLSQCFPSLHTLVLSMCALNGSDVRCLVQATRETRLPRLKHLDVSFNFKLIKATHSNFETQRRRHQESKTGVSVAPQKWLMSFKYLKKKTKKVTL